MEYRVRAEDVNNNYSGYCYPAGITGNMNKKKADFNSNLQNYTYSIQNYPNPFNPTTVISYSVAKDGIISLKVYNMLGQEVANLYQGYQKSGSYKVNFDASKLASGIYLYKLQSDNFTATKKMLLLK